MEREIEAIRKWFKQSGLKLNNPKIGICMFNKYNINPITIRANGFEIVSKKSVNVLEVIFYSNLNWSPHKHCYKQFLLYYFLQF
jgi:hypothetical protein